MNKNFKSILTQVVLATSVLASSSVLADDPLRVTFTHHSAAGNSFWQAVNNGMKEACELVKADCQMVFTQTEGDLTQQLSNMEAAVARGTDVLITSIVNDKVFDSILQKAANKGIIVLSANVDDSEGADGSARLSFIGQNFEAAGYALAKQVGSSFPKSGAIHVLVGVSAPGQSWSETRAAGIIRYVEEIMANEPSRDITYKRIDSGTDLSVTASRVSAYLGANSNTTAYMETGPWVAGAATAVKDRKLKGKVLLGGFDLIPPVIAGIEDGYINATVDQQPFLQGYLPVIQAHLMKKYNMGPWDVNTGRALVTIDNVDGVAELAKQGIR